jgi:hypothetical protein
MNEIMSETERVDVKPPKFQFSLWQLLFGSVCVGAGVVYSPIGTLWVVGLGSLYVFLFFGPQPWRNYAILGLLGFLVFIMATPVLTVSRGPRRQRVALQMMNAITMALQKYHDDFVAYPPDNFPSSNSSEALYHFLCTRLQSGEMRYGPYIENVQSVDSDGNGLPETNTVFGGNYLYVLRSDGKPLVIDCGPDRLLGGTINAQNGFVPDGTGDDKDNIYSTPPQ